MLILFDLDDSLLDHQAAGRAAAIDLYENRGITLPLPEFLTVWEEAHARNYARYYAGELSFEEQRRTRLREVINPTLTNQETDDLLARYNSVYEKNWALFPDALPCLDRLSPHRLGLISNGEGELQRQKLNKSGLAERFECIVISSECGYAKPDKRIFHHACELLNEKPQNAVYIGDRYDIDAQAAREAGLTGYWLDRKKAATNTHKAPVITSLAQFLL